MTPIEQGKLFEEQAKVTLEKEGYQIKRWFSKEKWNAPCDMLLEKGNKEIYCEVRGVTREKNPIIFPAQKIANLEALAEHTPVILFLIRNRNHKIVPLENLAEERYVAYPHKKEASNYYRVLERLSIRPKGGYIFKTGELTKSEGKKISIAKAEVEAKNNKECLLKLVDAYNELRRIKGRDIL